jgi:hypothetical protein
MAFSFYYGGYFDVADRMSQTVFAGLALVGVVLCLYLRTNLALVATYAVWLVILLVWQLEPTFPLVATLGGLYYSNYGRMSNALSLLQWLAVAIAVGYAALFVARVARRWLHRAGRSGPVRIPVAAAALVVAVFLGLCLGYASVNATTLKERYAQPEFVRVDDADLAAARYLEEHLDEGQRIMNNANDGSTYGYVFHGLPLVQVSTLGGSADTTKLLMSFDDLEHDRDVRELVCDMNIAWVVADEEAPLIGAAPGVTELGTDGLYSIPPGFRRLSTLSVVTPVFESGDVTVYEVDLDALQCDAVQLGG